MKAKFIIQPEVNVETIYVASGPISEATGRNRKWERTLDEEELKNLSESHDCAYSTDGVAAKAFASGGMLNYLLSKEP